MTRRQVAMLIHIERAERDEGGAPTASDLTRLLGVDSTAVTRMVDRLEDKELISRSTDPDDGRRHLISLRAGAKALLPELMKTARAVEARFEAGLSEKDLHTFQRVMLQMLENAGESLEAMTLHD